MPRFHRVHLAATSVRNLNLGGLRRIACMFHADRRAVQANPHRRLSVIQLCVVGFRGDHVRRRIPGQCLGNQLARQQAGDAGVAVGKVKKIIAFVLQSRSLKPHAREARISRL